MMKRTLLLSGIGAALALALSVSGALAAPVHPGAIGKSAVAADKVIAKGQMAWRGEPRVDRVHRFKRGHRFRHHPRFRFGLFFGPRYYPYSYYPYSYARPRCWWSYRYKRWYCHRSYNY